MHSALGIWFKRAGQRRACRPRGILRARVLVTYHDPRAGLGIIIAAMAIGWAHAGAFVEDRTGGASRDVQYR